MPCVCEALTLKILEDIEQSLAKWEWLLTIDELPMRLS